MAPVEELALLDIDRSNKGASKQRRDQINAEINIMRDLLPLPASSRQRLSQLQVMSLSCVYIRKCNVLQKLFRSQPLEQNIPDSLDFFQALTGFLLVTTREGKLLYISENVTDFLGHSMVDMKTQGDSLYDIVDKRDHGTVQAQLLQGGCVDPDQVKDVTFFCRMNMSRTLKRQSGFGDVKVMHVRGHFVPVNQTEGSTSSNSQHVFMANCSPLITPDLKENLVQNNTMVFKTVHQLDMTFVEVTKMAEYYLGFSTQEMHKKSWYSMLHPEDIHEAKEKHTQLIRSNHEMGCMMTVRMLDADDSVVWLNIVMHVRQSSLSHCEEPYIVCINQVISAQEAYQIKVQGQMFSVYPGRVQEMWGSHMANATPTNAAGSQWIQPSGNMLVSGYQNTNPTFASQSEYTPVYHQLCSTSQMVGQNGKVNMTARNGKMSNGLQTDKLKAMLKRKIQGPNTSCRPMKVAKMSWDYNGMQDGHDYSDMGEMSAQENHHNHSDVNYGHSYHNESVQVLHASNYKFGIFQAKKTQKAMSRGSYVNLAQHGIQTRSSPEQVVPDVNLPDSYLTPDPSPISSPQPSQAVVKMEVMDPDERAATAKSSVSILQALEKLASLPQGSKQPTVVVSSSNNGQHTPWQENSSNCCKKELPIFDAFDIDNFFDTLEVPEALSKASAKVEGMKLHHEIKTEETTIGSQSVKQKLAYLPKVKKEVDVVPCYSPPLSFQSCYSSSEDSKEVLQDQKDVQGSSILAKVKVEEFDATERKLSTSSDISGQNSKDLVISSTIVKSPGSDGSLESSAGSDSFDSLLNCFSDDGLDLSSFETDPRNTVLDSSLSENMLMEQFEITQEKFYNAASTNSIGKGYHSGHVTPEELSPHSISSSLAGEDEMIDSQSHWSLDMALDSLQSQRLDDTGSLCNRKDQDVLGMDSGFTQMDMFFNSLTRFEGSLDIPKHSP